MIMRKCDICSTPIPFGTDRCPSCGYRYKPERKLNQDVRQTKKAEYMSQFQPHPSPLDDGKSIFGKSSGINISEELSKFKKRTNYASPKNNRSNQSKLIKRIVLGIVIGSIVVTLIPIALFGIVNMSLDFSNPFNDDYVYDWESDYIYEWYSSYDELETNFPELAKEVILYRDYVETAAMNYNGSDSNYTIWEDYNVDEGELGSVYISTALEVKDTIVDMTIDSMYGEESMLLSYFSSSYLYEGVLTINNEVINALATVANVPVDELSKYAQQFMNEMTGDEYSQSYDLGEATFTIDYYDDYVDYSYSEYILLY